MYLYIYNQNILSDKVRILQDLDPVQDKDYDCLYVKVHA